MSEKTGFFEESPGVKSMARLMSFLFFIFSLPMDFLIITGSMKQFGLGSMTWQEMTFSIGMFLIVNLTWIAPKVLQKSIEEKGILSKMIDKT